MAVGAAIAAVVVTAASAYMQGRQAKKAAAERKEAGKVSAAEQAAQAAQGRRAQVREERVRRASILQSSQNTGVGQSSGELGATSALGSLISGNLAGMQRQQRSSSAIGELSQSAANYDLRGAQWQAVGQIAGSVFSAAAGGMGGGGSAPAPKSVQPTYFNASQGSVFNTTA